VHSRTREQLPGEIPILFAVARVFTIEQLETPSFILLRWEFGAICKMLPLFVTHGTGLDPILD
jgi:hypothetical protein